MLNSLTRLTLALGWNLVWVFLLVFLLWNSENQSSFWSRQVLWGNIWVNWANTNVFITQHIKNKNKNLLCVTMGVGRYFRIKNAIALMAFEFGKVCTHLRTKGTVFPAPIQEYVPKWWTIIDIVVVEETSVIPCPERFLLVHVVAKLIWARLLEEEFWTCRQIIELA